jgi:hypothetical protein
LKKVADERIAIIGLIFVAVWLWVVLPLYYLSWLSMAEKPTETVLGIGSLGWTATGAIASVVYDFLTAGILWFAGSQILSARKEARINRTLEACNRYDTDPILDAVTRRLAAASDDGTLKEDPKKYRIDLYSLFNYFESVAIGVNRGLYDASIVQDHLEAIIKGYVDDFIMSGVTGWRIPDSEGPDEYFFNLMTLYRKWQ